MPISGGHSRGLVGRPNFRMEVKIVNVVRNGVPTSEVGEIEICAFYHPVQYQVPSQGTTWFV